jgi:hypothetical protein
MTVSSLSSIELNGASQRVDMRVQNCAESRNARNPIKSTPVLLRERVFIDNMNACPVNGGVPRDGPRVM